jgi:hypothetical protein
MSAFLQQRKELSVASNLPAGVRLRDPGTITFLVIGKDTGRWAFYSAIAVVAGLFCTMKFES